MINGQAHVTSWFEVIFNPSFPYRMTHMLLASGLIPKTPKPHRHKFRQGVYMKLTLFKFDNLILILRGERKCTSAFKNAKTKSQLLSKVRYSPSFYLGFHSWIFIIQEILTIFDVVE
jgi:hypothetical protein